MNFKLTNSGIVTVKPLEYIGLIKQMPNENSILQVLELHLRENILHFQKAFNTKPRVLYYCCGPCPILYNNFDLQDFLSTNCEFIGIDLNPDYIEFNKYNYPQFDWQVADALTFDFENDISLLNSSYHHIPNNLKVDFLKNIKNNLVGDGSVIMGENLLPFYLPEFRAVSVNAYYDNLIESYQKQSISQGVIQLLELARCSDLNLDGEFKNHFGEFVEHLELASLSLISVEQLYPVESFLRNDENNSGSIVSVLKSKNPIYKTKNLS